MCSMPLPLRCPLLLRSFWTAQPYLVFFMNRRSSFSIPGYSQNAVLQLIVACGVGFILYHLSRVSMIVFGVPAGVASADVDSYTALAPLQGFKQHPWTILTYGWVHRGFM